MKERKGGAYLDRWAGPGRPSGFTLVELLVVIARLLAS